MAFLSPYRWIIVGLLVATCALAILRFLPTSRADPDPIQSYKTQEEYDRTVLNAFAKAHADAVIGVGDDAFTDYVFHELQDICPFYTPNGIAYRDCLQRMIENGKLDKYESVIESAEGYCARISTRYTGIERSNLQMSCIVYELTQ